jgi:hypothetical protein
VIDFLSIPAVRFQQESLSALNQPAVRFLQELLSAFSRNPCPLWSGIGVRFAQEQVSALHKIMQLCLTVNINIPENLYIISEGNIP